MVRAPAKSCPNLSRLFDEGEAGLVAAFLNIKPFERQTWLDEYRFTPNDLDAFGAASAMLQREKKENLKPLETEAARIVTIAGARGQFALDGLARTKLAADELSAFLRERDELARSLWAYLHRNALFEAAENSLHLRLYRRYDKHYQTFLIEPSNDRRQTAGDNGIEALLSDLGAKLDRGEGYAIDRFDLPAEGDEPAAEMFLLFHPNPPTSVREIDDEGHRSRIYFRPPGEAMIVYTPSTGRVHVRAASRNLRHAIAESFSETVLDQPLSSQPVDFQAYDVSRFFAGFNLAAPDLDDVVILRAQVIRAEVSIGNLANRLGLSTTLNQDISEIIDQQPGLRKTFKDAVAIRFIEIAVRYRRAGQDNDQTLSFTLTDRNTSSLLSLDDPFERVLGHRLLRAWDILREGRPPSRSESMAALPALLALWDIGAPTVTGAWLQDRGVDVRLLTEIGFLVPAGWEGDDLIDDEDDLGPMDARIVPRPEGPDLMVTEGQAAPVGSSGRFRVYRVRNDWVARHLREQVDAVVDLPAVEEVSPHLLALGALRIDEREVPVWLVRRLDDERVRAAVDTELRARSDQGIGLVLQAGNTAGTCLAANVLTPILDHLDGDAQSISLKLDSLRAVFRRNRNLARGGETVEFTLTGEQGGTLRVPGKGTIDISGANRVIVIRRLVEAHNNGPAPIATADLIKGIEGQSLANIFKQPLWDKLKADFLRSPKQGAWEIAV